MRRHKQLYQKITSTENLHKAIEGACKGRKNKESIATFLFYAEKELLQLQEQLQNKSYKPGRYKTFQIFDPKPRMISAAPVRDRVVHHALCNVIEPIFDNSFIHNSYANRKGKGTHAAVERFQQMMKGNRYVLKMDIKNYFPSIDHHVLKQQVSKKIACADTLWLINAIIDASNAQIPIKDSFPGDNLFTALERKKGLPIGNLTSQFFANVYLSPLDHFVKHQLHCKPYIRYVDDFVLLHHNKNQLYAWKREIISFLEKLRLKIHINKSQVQDIDNGIPFLGYRVFRFHRQLPKSNVHRMRKRMNKRYLQWQHYQINDWEFARGLKAWGGHARFAHTYLLRSEIATTFRHKGLFLF